MTDTISHIHDTPKTSIQGPGLSEAAQLALAHAAKWQGDEWKRNRAYSLDSTIQDCDVGTFGCSPFELAKKAAATYIDDSVFEALLTKRQDGPGFHMMVLSALKSSDVVKIDMRHLLLLHNYKGHLSTQEGSEATVELARTNLAIEEIAGRLTDAFLKTIESPNRGAERQ